jgi:hypothetical protein
MAECTFESCQRKGVAKGLCRTHYGQQSRGRPLTPIGNAWGSSEDRFWRNVDKRDGGCWIWTGYVNESGYGIFQRYRKPKLRAHRVSWELLRGAIPDGHLVDHDNPDFGCHNRACVNPDHLQVVVPATNVQRQKLRSDNRSGERGVFRESRKGLWRAEIAYTVNGVQKKMSKKSKDRSVVSAWVVEMRRLHHN